MSPARSHRCQPYPRAEAEALITNVDSGKRNVAGPLTAAIAVRSTDIIASGRDLWVIALRVGDQVLLFSHDAPAGASPSGPGLFAALDRKTSDMTRFPLATATFEGKEIAEACVRATDSQR